MTSILIQERDGGNPEFITSAQFTRSNFNPTMSEQSKVDLKSASDVKPRGANRSTKVAGKLKVLPEQPETLPLPGEKVSLPRIQKLRENAGSSGTTGDSEDGDIEESDESQAEVSTLLDFRMH